MSSVRLVMICAVALMRCANATGAASEPVELSPSVHSAPEKPAPVAGGLYDETAMREVLAGCALMIGDVRAELGKCEARGTKLIERVLELTAIADKLNALRIWAPVLTGILGTLLGGAIGVIVAVLR